MSETLPTIPVADANTYPCCDPKTCPGCGCCTDTGKAESTPCC